MLPGPSKYLSTSSRPIFSSGQPGMTGALEASGTGTTRIPAAIIAFREKRNLVGGDVLPVEVLQLGPAKTNKLRVRWHQIEPVLHDERLEAVLLRKPA